MYIMKFLRSQRGDTILEVLIVVAVLSLILVISFAATNRSAQGNRQAQERSEASKHAQSQIELLKKYISQTATPTLPPINFCMKDDGTPIAISDSIPPNAQLDDFSAIDGTPALEAACKNVNGGGEYYSYINRSGAGSNVFTAHTRWYKVGGNGIDEATMVHRLYPDLASGNNGGGVTTTLCPGWPVNGLNPVGACVQCPNGYGSAPGGYSPCLPLPPKIVVTVKKIPPVFG